MELLNHRLGDSGLLLETGEGLIRIQAFGPATIRITYTRRDAFSDRPSLCVLPRSSPLVLGQAAPTEGGLDYVLPGLRLRVDRSSCAFSYFDAEGRLLVREPRRGGKSLQPFTLEKFVADGEGRVVAQEGADGLAAKLVSGKRVPDRPSFHGRLSFEWAEGEALYGLGSHEEGVMNLRGTSQYLYQQNMKVVVPVLVSTRGYGILVDNASPLVFRDDSFGSYVRAEACEELDYYFFAAGCQPATGRQPGSGAPVMADLVKAYRGLTGSAPMLPRWAFGYAQSKERYKSQEEILGVAREFRLRGIPLDIIVLDWMSWLGQLWGQKSFDPSRFPDPEAMIQELHAMGVRFMISIWPNMREGGDNHAAMRDAGFLLGNGMTYDAFNPEARELYWKQAREGLFSKGVDAWWCDCTEPFEADWNGAFKREPEERAAINVGEATKYLDMERLNAYSLLHSEAIYKGQRAASDTKRVVNLTRSGFAGQQRYSTIVWSGDVCATWETLRSQVPAGLNFCASGLPWWSTDIGAFFVKSRPDLWFWRGDYEAGCEDPGYRELYLRWLQYGTFLPLFRSHGTDTPREPWRFGDVGGSVYEAIVAFIRLRSRLLPYLYSSAADVSLRDGTMMRPLAFDFPGDRLCHDIKDQYLFGPSLMPSPMLTSLDEAGPSRSVYLPAGCDWYDFWTGEKHSGGWRIDAAAPLGILPLYAKAGSILPLGPVSMHAEAGRGTEIELRVYSGADADFSLYDDAGDGYGYERGEFSECPVHWDEASRTLSLGARRGSFPGMADSQAFRAVLVGPGWGAGPGEEFVACTRLVWDGSPASLRL